jgi:hypothetical protein
MAAPGTGALPILNPLFSIFAFISIFAFSLQPFLPAIALATAGAFSPQPSAFSLQPLAFSL